MSYNSSNPTLLEYFKTSVKVGEKKRGISKHYPAITLMYLIVLIHKLTDSAVNRTISKDDYESSMKRLRDSFKITPSFSAQSIFAGTWNPYVKFYFPLHSVDNPAEYWKSMKHTVPDEIRDYIDQAIEAYPKQ